MPRKSLGPCLATLLCLALLHGCSGDSGQAGPPGTGGTGGGATGGSGGATGGSGGATGGSGGSSGGDPTAALDACFAGLRTLTMVNQIATKRSADGRYT